MSSRFSNPGRQNHLDYGPGRNASIMSGCLLAAIILQVCAGCSATRSNVLNRYSAASASEVSIVEQSENRIEKKNEPERNSLKSDLNGECLSEQPVIQAAGKEDTGQSLTVPATVSKLADDTLELTPNPIPDHPQQGMTLQTLEQIALANNPAIQQAAAAAFRARGIRNQVGLKPNPEFGYSGVQLADAGTDQHAFFVEQTFVRGDKLAWNRAVLGHEVNSMNWLFETQRQRLLTDVRLAFYEALVAQQKLELAQNFRNEALKGVQVSEDRVKAGVAAKPDVLQSEIQLSEVDLAIRQAELAYSAAWNEMAALSGIPGMSPAPLIGELQSPDNIRTSQVEYERITANSPYLMAARARVDRARTNLQRQQQQPVPNVNGQMGAGYDNGTDQGFLNVQVSLPLPVHNKNQGNIQAAHAEFCEAVRNVERIEMSIRRDLAVTMREYQVAATTVKQYEQIILPKAREAMELMQTARDSGEFDFLRVLTTRRAYYDANVLYVIALGELSMANAKIEGLLLTDGLNNIETYDGDDSLRGAAIDGQ